MANAWLDSLSEDWISQPRSTESPVSNLSAFDSSAGPNPREKRSSSTRIPIASVRKHTKQVDHDSSLPLSERSASNNNIFLSQRLLRRGSKTQHQSANDEGIAKYRSTSVATTGSVQRNTVNHTSSNNLSDKQQALQEVPEWRRRLLHGDVGYGEQCDLFGPIGLENIFRPPLRNTSADATQSIELTEPILASNSHDFVREAQQMATGEDLLDRGTAHRREPRSVQYRLTELDGDQFSENDLSRGSSFGPVLSTSLKATNTVQATEVTWESSRKMIRTQNRIASGQSDVYHEDLSPIFIARHETSGGSVDYSALDIATASLPNHENRTREVKFVQETPQELSNIQMDDHTSNTESFAHIGQFVNMNRGGVSEDESFQRRMLSPSSLSPIEESAILQEMSVEASTPKQFPDAGKSAEINEASEHLIDPTSPSLPPVPHPSPIKTEQIQMKTGSGSPLKLFGTYNTFTNQMLLRRLSQFEESLPKDTNGEAAGENADLLPPKSVNDSVGQTAMDEAYIATSAPSSELQNHRSKDGIDMGEFPRFGEGYLDEFEFSEDVSRDSNSGSNGNPENAFFPVERSFSSEQPSGQHGSSRSRKSARQEPLLPGNRSSMSFEASSQPGRLRKSSLTLTQGAQDANVSKQSDEAETPRKRYGDAESKRLPKSPLKVSTPKRRRTLHKSDISHDVPVKEIKSVAESHQQLQSVIGRKRKDAKNGDSQQPADAQVMAARQILRPRTHAIGHRDNVDTRSVHIEKTTARLFQASVDIEGVSSLDVASQLKESGHFSVGAIVGPGVVDGSRKGSVTTQDFLDEAKKIMAGIRGKARPRTGLNSVEESESDNDNHNLEAELSLEHDVEDSYEESTKEPFSRPPSREGGGGPLPRIPPKQDDPNILNYLKRYEELSEVDGIMASSMKSISLGSKTSHTANRTKFAKTEAIPRASSLHTDVELESDPPNIQITEYPEVQRKRKYSTSSRAAAPDEAEEVAYPSNGSNGDGQSTGRSIPTGSSRGSDSRGMILPPTISHLIPEELAGMVFDRERSVWVKRKDDNVDRATRKSLVSNTSDDDPFGDIPDLTVDEAQEMLRVAPATTPIETGMDLSVDRPPATQSDPVNGGIKSEIVPSLDPKTSSSRKSSHMDGGTGLSDLSDKSTAQKTYADVPEFLQAPDADELVEEEISIHESRLHSDTTNRRRPNVTISFSSPLASIIPESNYDRSFEDEVTGVKRSEMSVQDDVVHKNKEATALHVGGDLRKGPGKRNLSQRPVGRCLSVDGHSFVPRPVSRIDEQDERSFFDSQQMDRNRRSVSLIISTPLPSHYASTTVATISPRGILVENESLYNLSPLSDFTINQSDDSFALDVSYIGKKRSNPKGTRTLSISVKHLVQNITDVEPYEPFWEHMKQLDLKGKKLQTLHMLDRFCSQLEELDVSENCIQQLDGAPQTIRRLQISRNSLTDLTSWHQFSNLQYVDVSNNGLTTFEAFKSLVHLRGLRADNNKLRTLNGILHLDGLLSLRLRNNTVEELDLKDSTLQRLTELDLKGNCIRTIRQLEQLRSLMTLNLEDNDLQDFDPEGLDFFWSLKYLRLSGNQIRHVDVGRFPSLRLLYLDRNRLGRVTGLLRTKHLDSLSMHEQQAGCVIDTGFLDEAFELRKLFLSGNLLTEIRPRVDFLNLQYLELANGGLESLPNDLGQLMPNVRVLNLNFNAIQDIKPLLGMIRLKKLHLAGNRITRLRKTTSILAQFSNIVKLDLRNNPLTLGFYPPLSEKRLVVHIDGMSEPDPIDPFTLENGDGEEDKAYSSRLDLTTKMRRRVYEILMIGGCTRLRVLDGMTVDRASIDIKDKVWEELLKAEIVVDGCPTNGASGCPEGSHQQSTTAGHEEQTERTGENHWPAEDSFG